jgi:hypothetical protein
VTWGEKAPKVTESSTDSEYCGGGFKTITLRDLEGPAAKEGQSSFGRVHVVAPQNVVN